LHLRENMILCLRDFIAKSRFCKFRAQTMKYQSNPSIFDELHSKHVTLQLPHVCGRKFGSKRAQMRLARAHASINFDYSEKVEHHHE
jgi:hypothetical protein